MIRRSLLAGIPGSRPLAPGEFLDSAPLVSSPRVRGHPPRSGNVRWPP